MQRLPDEKRLASKLSFLGQSSRDQLLRYMLALSAITSSGIRSGRRRMHCKD